MMSFTFDLISDLHIETWPETFDWTSRSTSPHCLVLGDVARDRYQLIEALKHLGKCYQAVFYIDGNEEHADYRDDLVTSYRDLTEKVTGVHNIVYLQDNVVVVDGVAILGTNGWWGFDFDGVTNPEQSAQWYAEKEQLNPQAIDNIRRMSTTDASYMMASVRRLQTHIDVKKIVIATHTVPHPALIAHDIDLDGSLRFNTMGNAYMQSVLAADTEQKIHTWCFGHYHGSVDQIHNNIRYVNNCRGRGNTQYSNWVYHPKRITIDF
jgi:predicted phosphodiesterase